MRGNRITLVMMAEIERRGLVVNIYYDPENPTNSTQQTLSDLEWTGGHLII